MSAIALYFVVSVISTAFVLESAPKLLSGKVEGKELDQALRKVVIGLIFSIWSYSLIFPNLIDKTIRLICN